MSVTSTYSRVDVENAQQNLRNRGVALFQLASRQDLLDFSREFGALLSHRDADPDTVTVVKHDPGLTGQPGYDGLSSRHLNPHTDGSGNFVVPRYITLWCANDASEGGESVFIDGEAALADLSATAPWAAEALSAPRAVIFKSGDESYEGPVFCRDEEGNLRVRLRLDSQGYFSAAATSALGELRTALARQAWTLGLRPGQGYIIDNWRVLHGRRAFSGSREMLRTLVA